MSSSARRRSSRRKCALIISPWRLARIRQQAPMHIDVSLLAALAALQNSSTIDHRRRAGFDGVRNANPPPRPSKACAWRKSSANRIGMAILPRMWEVAAPVRRLSSSAAKRVWKMRSAAWPGAAGLIGSPWSDGWVWRVPAPHPAAPEHHVPRATPLMAAITGFSNSSMPRNNSCVRCYVTW